MINRGLVISKQYEKETKEEIKDYQVENYNLNIKFNFNDGIIHFDNRKSHIVNCRQILNHYFNLRKEFSYEDYEFLKKKINNLDGQEIYLSNILAAMGEIVVLYGDYEEEENLITSTMVFLPKDLEKLTDKQINKIKSILNMREEDYFGAALCDGNVDNLMFFEKNETYELLDHLKEKSSSLS